MSAAPLPLDALDLEVEAVRERFAWARARGHPYFLWPDVAPAAWRRALAEIGRAAAAALAGTAAALDGAAGARALGIAAYTSGTGPLLGRWIEDGALDAPDDVAAILRLHLEHGRRRADRIAAAFAPIAARCAELGARATVVKGFHTARAYFPEPGARPVSDVDLVAAPAHLALVERALDEGGLRPRPVLSDPYMCEWTPPGAAPLPRSLELTHVHNAWGVDLHGGFDRDFGGAHRVALVADGAPAAAPWPAGGAALDALREPWLTAYLSAHASQELKNLTLVRLVELVWVIRSGCARGALDWRELAVLLEPGRRGRFVYPALALVERLAPDTVDAGLLAALERDAPPRVRRVVARLEPWSAQRLDGVSLEEHFLWADGPASYLRRLARALWPAWAGPAPAIARLHGARVRQLLAGRVSLGGPADGGR